MITALPRLTVLLPNTGSSTAVAGVASLSRSLCVAAVLRTCCTAALADHPVPIWFNVLHGQPGVEQGRAVTKQCQTLNCMASRLKSMHQTAALTCINLNGQVLKQKGCAILNALNDFVNVLGLALLDNDQPSFSFPVLNPLDALQVPVQTGGLAQ